MTKTKLLREYAFARLGNQYSDIVTPATFAKHKARYCNMRWAERIGLGRLNETDWTEHFGTFGAFHNGANKTETAPRAIRYHGHQFRKYNPNLGDGRGFLLAQCRDLVDGRLLDLSTKGTGLTLYSRYDDGKLSLKAAAREAVASELLEALGVYSVKTLSVMETGEALNRGEEKVPGGIMVRLSDSLLRFGVFQLHAYEGDRAALGDLVRYTVEHYFPEVRDTCEETLPIKLFDAIMRRCAHLVASWMAAGFTHGVLNTDNLNVTGESFDYGTFDFFRFADPEFTVASFDQKHLYAYARQPAAIKWGLERLAEAFSLITLEEPLQKAVDGFDEAFAFALRDAIFARLGLRSSGTAQDFLMVAEIFQFLFTKKVPFETFFFDWFAGELSGARALEGPNRQTYGHRAFKKLKTRLLSYEPIDGERLDSAYFEREAPFVHTTEDFEEIWHSIENHNDWARFSQAMVEIALLRNAYGFNPQPVATVFPPPTMEARQHAALWGRWFIASGNEWR